MEKETKEWLSKMYEISEDDILWYNSGICYDRIIVSNEESAIKVSQKVKGTYVNGGLYDGMELGQYDCNDGRYDVMC